MLSKMLETYNPRHIRGVACEMVKKYQDLAPEHVFLIAKKLMIYPDAKTYKDKEYAVMAKLGKINKNNTEYVEGGSYPRLTDAGVKAVENYLITEGYKLKVESTEEKMSETRNIWEQVDLISLMKQDYEKAIAERDSAVQDAEQYCALAEEYTKEIEELKDRLLIAEKENNELKEEKKKLGKMQIDVPNFSKEIEGLQTRIGKYNSDINLYSSEVNELRKDVAALQTSVNRLQDQKKKLEGVISDLIGCSKRIMNLK